MFIIYVQIAFNLLFSLFYVIISVATQIKFYRKYEKGKEMKYLIGRINTSPSGTFRTTFSNCKVIESNSKEGAIRKFSSKAPNVLNNSITIIGTVDENDQLIFNSSDGMMVFARIAAEIPETDIFEIEVTNPEVPGIGTDDPAVILQDIKAPEISFTPVGADGVPFLGTWSLATIELDDMQMDPAMLGMTMVLTFNEDGSVISDDGFEPYTTPWYVEGGAAIVDGMALTLNNEGQLIMNDGEGTMIFTQGEAAPSGELTEEEQLLALLQLLGQMMETEESSGFDYLNTKFVCTSYSTSGVTLDGATLGAEFGVYFRDNGTADLILAGYTMENLPYTITDEGVYAVNYFGTFFNCTPTDTGFDMDYYGTMTMHCTPAE